METSENEPNVDDESAAGAETDAAATTVAEAPLDAAPVDLKKAVETLLFIADQPVPLAKLCAVVKEKDQEKVGQVVSGLVREYEEQGRAIQILEIAGGFQMATRSEFAPQVRKLYSEKMTMRLSTAALETLAIIGYKQPLTRAEIEEIRGVEVIAALETLLEKRLIKVVGRKETVGRPLLYGTSPEFLRHFGLRKIEDLPPIDSFTPAEPRSEGPLGPFALEGTAAEQAVVAPPAAAGQTVVEVEAQAADQEGAVGPAAEDGEGRPADGEGGAAQG